MTEEKKQYIQQILSLLCSLYNKLYEEGKVAFPLAQMNLDKLESVVKTIEADYFGSERFPNSAQKAGAYFTLLIKSHSVSDGNKRLAVLFLEAFCQIKDLRVNTERQPKLDELAVSVAKTDIAIEQLYMKIESILFLAE